MVVQEIMLHSLTSRVFRVKNQHVIERPASLGHQLIALGVISPPSYPRNKDSVIEDNEPYWVVCLVGRSVKS